MSSRASELSTLTGLIPRISSLSVAQPLVAVQKGNQGRNTARSGCATQTQEAWFGEWREDRTHVGHRRTSAVVGLLAASSARNFAALSG
jgi:hypothetical protein